MIQSNKGPATTRYTLVWGVGPWIPGLEKSVRFPECFAYQKATRELF